MELRKFLDAHKVTKGEDFTHTCLRHNECYYISGKNLTLFYDIYSKSLEEGSKPSITEKHKPISPILIDLDFRHVNADRIYDKAFVYDFLNVLLTVIRDYVDQDEMSVYVLEKPSPRRCKENYKDGLHIIIPDVITQASIQYKIRDDILAYHKNKVIPEGSINTAEEIYDEAVIERNNWFMYGSRKPDEEHEWKMTESYIIQGKESKARTESTLRDLVEALSLRRLSMEESRYTKEGRKALKATKLSPHDSVMSFSSSLKTSSRFDLKLVKELVNLLSVERADKYDTWMRVGWCLHNIDESLYETWLEFSNKSPKFNPTECGKLWVNMIEDGGLNIGSLHMWAKEDSPLGYMDLMARTEYPANDILMSPTNYDYNYVKKVFEKTHAKILNPLCYVYLKADSEVVKDESTMYKTYRNLYCTRRSGETQKVEKFIKVWLDDRNARFYESMDFCPPPRETKCENMLNLWHGFAIDRISCESSQDIEPFLEHIRVLVGFDVHGFNYMIKWLAHLIQCPGALNATALIFLSEEGAGKNIFWDRFSEIIGREYYYETANPSRDLFGRFCNGRKGKLLIDIDEAQSKDTFANSEAFKNMISTEYINYEKKGVDPIQIQNFARVIFTTNNLLCAKISDSTRRYVIYETSKKYIGNADYFRKFNDYMKDTKNQKAIIEYLRGINISEVNWITERPITDTYKALKTVCADPILKYMLFLWENNRFQNTYIEKASLLLTTFHGFLKERLHMKEEGINIWNSTIFGLKMKGLCDDEASGITKLKGRKYNDYCIDMKTLKVYLENKGMITEDSYMFLDNIDN